MRFHLTPDGPKKCVAEKRPCKYAEHFDTLTEAEEHYEKQMLDLSGSKVDARGAKSAEVSRGYAHWSILNDHLHNSFSSLSEIEPAEILYYTSEQGRLELARRSAGAHNEEYLRIRELIEAGEINQDAHAFDEANVKELVARGEESFPNDFKQFYKQLFEERDLRGEQRHALVERSHTWLKRLTPEEQEAVSWATSNGFRLLQYLDEPDSKDFYFKFDDFIDENAIYDADPYNYDAARAKVETARRDFAERYRDTLMSAMKKAPKMSTPVVIGRGTAPQELQGILGLGAETKDMKKVYTAIEKGEFEGRSISPNSHLKRGPESASSRGAVAYRFSKSGSDRELTERRDIILAIKSKSFASPVNVSAWSTAEYEVLTNPHANYVIRRGKRMPNNVFVLELEEV